MDAKTKALSAHRARLKKRGMKRLEVWVPAREADVVRRAASVLREQSGEAARLRQALGFSGQAEHPESAIDIFAMTAPLSPAGEALWDETIELVQRDRKNRALNRPRKIAL
jgi:hypothetical protein